METLSALFLISLSLLQYFSGTYSTTLTITNNCNDIIWPVVLANPGSSPLPGPSGFPLGPGASQTLPGPVPSNWSGRVWARTHCTTAPDGRFLCATGDCGTATVDGSCSCDGAGKISPPATAAEFSPGVFAVSVVAGYNLPISVDAGGCGTASCSVDSDSVYYSPELFKKWCPQALTYEYDNTGTVFPCDAADYVVSFCRAVNSGTPYTNGTDRKGFRTGNIPDDNSNISGKIKLDVKFTIMIGVSFSVAISLGTISVTYIWRRSRKSECEVTPGACDHHSDKCENIIVDVEPNRNDHCHDHCFVWFV